MFVYNPFLFAAMAAYNELTCDRACQYYQHRAQQDAVRCQQAFGVVIWAIGIAAVATYSAGQELADVLRDAAGQAQSVDPQLTLAPVAIAGYLPPARPVPTPVAAVTAQANNERWILQSLRTAIACRHLINSIENPVIASGASPTLALAPRAKRPSYSTMSKTGLLAECTRLGIPASQRDTRAALLNRLQSVKVPAYKSPTRVGGKSID